MAQAKNCKEITGDTAETECKKVLGCRWNQSACDWCQPGQYKSSGETCQSDCTGANKVVNPGRTACIDSSSSGKQCPRDSVVGTPDTQCFCNSGFGANEAGDGCEQCAAGTFRKKAQTSTEDTVVCTKCADGFISSLGEEECRACNKDSQVSNNARTVCLCKDGWGISTTSSDTCTKCPKGFYGLTNLADTEKKACTQCPAGQISKNEGSKECETCPQGQTSNDDHTECVPGTNPSTASAAVIATIIIALLAMVAAAAITAVVAVRARKARAAEAEALTAENM